MSPAWGPETRPGRARVAVPSLQSLRRETSHTAAASTPSMISGAPEMPCFAFLKQRLMLILHIIPNLSGFEVPRGGVSAPEPSWG